MSKIEVAIDTTVILGMFEHSPHSDNCREICRLAGGGVIDPAVTAMVDMDDTLGWAMRWVMRGIQEGFLTEIPGVFRLRYSNAAAPQPVEPDHALESGMIESLRPKAGGTWKTLDQNTQKDVDHLMGHAQNGRDFFVTSDKGILKRQLCLKKLGIAVMDPDWFIEAWNRQDR